MPSYQRMDDDVPSMADSMPLVKLTRRTKSSFVIFNVLYLIGGLICLACGGLVLVAFQTDAVDAANKWIGSHGVLRNDYITLCPQMLIVAGTFSLLFSILGFAYARRRQGLAIAFTLLLVTTMFFQWLTAFSAYDVNRELSRVRRGMLHLQNATTGNASDLVAYRSTNLLVNIQADWKCCGVYNSSEWLTQVGWFEEKYSSISKQNPGRQVVLDGCCGVDNKNNNNTCQDCVTGKSECKIASPDAVYSQGCADVITAYLHNFFMLICVVAAIFGTVQLFGLFSAIYLATSFGKTNG